MVQSILLKKRVFVTPIQKQLCYDYFSQQNYVQTNEEVLTPAAEHITDLETETFTRVNGEGTDVHDNLII